MSTTTKSKSQSIRDFVASRVESKGEDRAFWAQVRSIQQGDPSREIRNMSLVFPPDTVIRGNVRENIMYLASRDALVFTANMLTGSGRSTALTTGEYSNLGWSIGQLVSQGESHDASYRSANKLILCLAGASDEDEFRGHLRRVSSRLRSGGAPVNPVILASDLFSIYHGIRSGVPSDTLYQWAASFEKSSSAYSSEKKES